jgi:hypothetical protein
MSKINGEKARAAIAKKRRTAQRVKDRAALAAIRAGASKDAPAAKPAETKES